MSFLFLGMYLQERHSAGRFRTFLNLPVTADFMLTQYFCTTTNLRKLSLIYGDLAFVGKNLPPVNAFL